MSQYIVCKVRGNGTIIAGTPPTVHDDFDIAKAEAERLISQVGDAQAFIIFKAFARSERAIVPVRTVFLS